MKLYPIVCILFYTSSIHAPLAPNLAPFDIEPQAWPSVYEIACQGTIVPPELLRAIAVVESGEYDRAVSRDGLDIGRMQLREMYHAERARRWGEYDPRDPVQAARIAARIIEADYLFLGSWALALSAYNQGRARTIKTGNRWEYLSKISKSLDAMRPTW